jgi:hypothetical protein
LKGTNYPTDLDLILVGRFTSINPPDEAALMFRWDYLDESLGRIGQAAWFTWWPWGPADVPRIIQTIDDMFRSSALQPRPRPKRDFSSVSAA